MGKAWNDIFSQDRSDPYWAVWRFGLDLSAAKHYVGPALMRSPIY